MAAAVGSCAGPAPLIELGIRWRAQTRGRPRLFALPVDSPRLPSRCRRGSSELLAASGSTSREKRPFWPHVTVARVRPEERGSRRPLRVERPPEELPQDLVEPFDGVRLTLYRSELQPQGARYVPLAQVELPGAGGSEVMRDGRQRK